MNLLCSDWVLEFVGMIDSLFMSGKLQLPASTMLGKFWCLAVILSLLFCKCFTAALGALSGL